MKHEKYEDCCVVCGEYVPEGIMVCKDCSDNVLCNDVVFKNVKQNKKRKSRANMGNKHNKNKSRNNYV